MNTSKRFITSCSDKAPITSISSGHLFSCHAEKDMAVAVQRSHYIKQLQLVVITKLKQYSPGCSQRCCSEKSVSYNRQTKCDKAGARPTKGQRNEAKMNVELSPTILSPLYAKRAQKPDDANPMSS